MLCSHTLRPGWKHGLNLNNRKLSHSFTKFFTSYMRNSIFLDSASKPTYGSSSSPKSTTLWAEISHPSVLFLPVPTNSKIIFYNGFSNNIKTIYSSGTESAHIYRPERCIQLTVLGEWDFVRHHPSCLSTIVPVRQSKGLECSPF